MRVTIVQLGRYGDILNLLPLVQHLVEHEGWWIRWIACDEFRDVLEGVPYVAEKLSVPTYDLRQGVKLANSFPEAVRIPQIWQNPRGMYLRERYRNFQRAQWALLAGDSWSERLYEWPLELSVRKWRSGVGGATHQVEGYSAPPYKGELPGKPLVQVKRFLDLDLQLSTSSVFFGVDSGPLYLAEAVGVPTVGLIPDVGWTAREPNPRWLAYRYYRI